ncbi:guanine nucleotide-binding protein subunit beta [Heracleum sosnowskyi]|uniref:Guanine nucleotide-binding protein subunit beta n=1 Tax=Heracleum sosnowskyi TaxID=360622 RepID=A0AAD8N1W9_9APIA|nr:guanine nucleotide-binding protein subunit beta [Heracleum sosnowskyi]
MEGVSRKRGRPRVVVTEAVAEARRLAVQQRNLRRDRRKVAGYFKAQNKLPVTFTPTDLVCCRTLQGHSDKVYSLDWTPEKNRIVSASQDGRLIVWNALTSQKTHAIKLPCPWDGNVPVSRMLSGHKGYVSSCQYVPDEDTHLITSSGDHTCILWDITTGLRTSVFGGEFQSGHTADVLSVSINGSNSRMFVSGSCDATARLFGTSSEDGTCRLFDIRTGHQLQVYKQPNSDSDIAQVTSIAFSISGRLLFAGYANDDCYVWDTLLAQVVLNLGSLHNSHEGRISCLGLSADGSALCTGRWDSNLKIWAFGGHRKVT